MASFDIIRYLQYIQSLTSNSCIQAFSGNLDKYSKNAVIQLSKLIFDGHDPRNSQLFQQRYMTNAQVYAILEEQLPKIQRVFSIRQIALLITEHKEHLGKLTWKRSSGDNTKVRSLYALKIVCTRQSINYSTNRVRGTSGFVCFLWYSFDDISVLPWVQKLPYINPCDPTSCQRNINQALIWSANLSWTIPVSRILLFKNWSVRTHIGHHRFIWFLCLLFKTRATCKGQTSDWMEELHQIGRLVHNN